MKIKFLGTSHGAPMPGRCCQGILIETEKGAYIIDAGAPIMEKLIGYGFDITMLKGVFITHPHIDHTVGLCHLLGLSTWWYKEKASFEVYFPNEKILKIFDGFNSGFFGETPDRLKLKTFAAGVVYNDGNLKVTAFENCHMKNTGEKSYGFMVDAEGKKVLITGDMSKNFEHDDFPFEVLSAGVDLLISECAHFPAEMLCENISKVKASKVAVVHVHPESQYEVLKTRDYILPDDGDEIII